MADGSYEVRQLVSDLGREGAYVTDIVKQTGVSRNTIIRWLASEDIDPRFKRGETGRRESARTLSNTPLALSIEAGVRRRLAEQEET